MTASEAITAYRAARRELERVRLILVARSDEAERARVTFQHATIAVETAQKAMMQAITEGE